MKRIDDILFIKIMLVLIMFTLAIFTCLIIDSVTVSKNELEINCKN